MGPDFILKQPEDTKGVKNRDKHETHMKSWWYRH